jgi:hypothetical protein
MSVDFPDLNKVSQKITILSLRLTDWLTPLRVLNASASWMPTLAITKLPCSIIEGETFCYKVMPFRLKNARATY